jgi:hypothetical protein
VTVRLRLEGMDTLLQALHEAPQEIRAEAMDRVRNATEGAANDFRQRLVRNRVTGTLANSVRTVYAAADQLVGRVRSTAPHSHLFRWGTKRNRTVAGKNGRYRGANRGRMPAADAPTIVDIARRWRRVMVRDLVALVRGKGFEVRE